MWNSSEIKLIGIGEDGYRVVLTSVSRPFTTEKGFYFQSFCCWKTKVYSPVAILAKDDIGIVQIGYGVLDFSETYTFLLTQGTLHSFKIDFPSVIQPSQRLQDLVNWEISLLDDPTCIDAYHDWLIDNELYDAAKELIPSQY